MIRYANEIDKWYNLMRKIKLYLLSNATEDKIWDCFGLFGIGL